MGVLPVKRQDSVYLPRYDASHKGTDGHMTAIAWTMLAGGALAGGAALVGLLALRRAYEPLMLLSGMLSMGVCGAGVARVAGIYSEAGMTIFSVFLAFGCVAGGYGLASSVLTGLAVDPQTFELLDDPPDQERGIAVLLLACIESEHYDPRAVARELKDLVSAGLPEATVGVTPFLYAAQKARYRAVGGRSNSAAQARAVCERLESALDKGRFAMVDRVTCAVRDTLAGAVVRLQREGYGRVVVASLSVAESFDVDRAKSEVDALRPDLHGMRIAYTSPLWASDELAEMVAERVAVLLVDPETTGAVLVMHGQSELRERSHATFDVQENAFSNRVRMMLIDRGFPENNVRLCWAEWRSPDVTESVRHLAALGCTRIVVSPVCYPLESIATVLDMSVAVRQARVSSDTYVTTLPAWGDDPQVTNALTRAIAQAAEEFAD